MTPEKEQLLIDTYPKILKINAGYMGHGCEIAVGDGWYQILFDLCAELQAISDKTGEQIVATQIKEKFGGLRFYANNADQDQYKLISKAEHLADKTCEVCGAPGLARNTSWIKTLCSEHYK